MRINVLQQREPLGQIIAETLSVFWEQQYGRKFTITWQERKGANPQMGAAQEWLCNPLINAIFTSDANPRVFGPIRSEFARSLHWWRTPFQMLYVMLACSQPTGSWLSQTRLYVTPTVPDHRNTLLIPGNNKVRIVNSAHNVVYNLRKCGFNRMFLDRELSSRQIASKLGVPVPQIHEIGENGQWFSEQYVEGTPVNRLGDSRRTIKAIEEILRKLVSLGERTLETMSGTDHVGKLVECCKRLGNDQHLLEDVEKRRICQIVEALASSAEGVGESASALSHGDFQPGNILAEQDRLWLIDWEYSTHRMSGYDLLVYHLDSRYPKGLSTRLGSFVEGSVPELGASLSWPGTRWDSIQDRRLTATLFLMEELALYLEENSNPRTTKITGALRPFLTEVERWLKSS